MRQLIVISLFLVFSLSYNSQSLPHSNSENEIKIITFSDFKNLLEKNNDKLLVINFWATWCLPCVEEIPTFMKVNEKYKNISGYKMILINLNNVKNLAFIKKFIQKKSINTEVYLLNEYKNINTWLPAVDSSWTGSIPATIFYKNGTKISFKEKKLEEEELESIIKSNL